MAKWVPACRSTSDFGGFTGTVQIAYSSSYAGTITNFKVGDTLDLGYTGGALDATIDAGNILTVDGNNGTISLQLDPNADYSAFSPVVTDDGNGGTNVTLEPISHTITFTETGYNPGDINPVYTFPDNTVNIIGQIVYDGAQPASPDIAANTSYTGPVFIDFTNAVTHVELDAGYLQRSGQHHHHLYRRGRRHSGHVPEHAGRRGALQLRQRRRDRSGQLSSTPATMNRAFSVDTIKFTDGDPSTIVPITTYVDIDNTNVEIVAG